MSIKTTPMSVSIHQDGDSPVFGESAVHVMVNDDAAGPFLKIKQNEPLDSEGWMRIDLDELEAVLKVARELIAAHTK